MRRTALFSVCAFLGASAVAQEKALLPALPAPQSVPKTAADTGRPYAPQAILPGGIVVTLFPPDSPYLKADRLHVPEIYHMSQAVPGRISSIVSIHNPSIEVHLVEKSINTGTAVIAIAGGGHRTLNVGGEAADFVPFFYNYGINTVILRNRLRADGYVAEVDAVHDAQQAVRVVRAYTRQWGIDPRKIGVMGFSAGAELAAPAALLYDDWDRTNNGTSDPFAGTSSRRTSSASSTPAQRPSPATARRRWFRRTSRPHSSSAPVPATASTPSGPSITTRQCWPPACRTWRCTFTGTDGTRVTRCRMGAACPAD